MDHKVKRSYGHIARPYRQLQQHFFSVIFLIGANLQPPPQPHTESRLKTETLHVMESTQNIAGQMTET